MLTELSAFVFWFPSPTQKMRILQGLGWGESDNVEAYKVAYGYAFQILTCLQVTHGSGEEPEILHF